MRLGIVGFGAFGQLAARHLKKRCTVLVTDSRNKRREARRLGVKFVSLSAACGCDAVFFCVPTSSLEHALRAAKPFLKPGTVVVDACSVKVLPCTLMKRLLPRTVELVGTHPLFGPQSAKGGIANLRIVICPVRVKKWRFSRVKSFLSRCKLTVEEMTPREHDALMARTQAIMHFLARALERTGFSKERTSLISVRKMQAAIGLVREDSPQLFDDLQVRNPFARIARKKLLRELNAIEARLE